MLKIDNAQGTSIAVMGKGMTSEKKQNSGYEENAKGEVGFCQIRWNIHCTFIGGPANSSNEYSKSDYQANNR